MSMLYSIILLSQFSENDYLPMGLRGKIVDASRDLKKFKHICADASVVPSNKAKFFLFSDPQPLKKSC